MPLNVDKISTGSLSVNGTDITGNAPYKVYTALLTQSGGDDPVATVLENTLGGEVVWTRDNLGVYLGTFTNAFVNSNTIIFLSPSNAGNGLAVLWDFPSGNDEVRLSQYDETFSPVVYLNTSIEIRVYN